jgi:hypothetical protein
MTSAEWALLIPAVVAFITALTAFVRGETTRKVAVDGYYPGPAQAGQQQALGYLSREYPVKEEVKVTTPQDDVNLSNPVGNAGAQLMGIASPPAPVPDPVPVTEPAPLPGPLGGQTILRDVTVDKDAIIDQVMELLRKL